ncbi:MAG: hypothetical protein JW809_13225 [Pirellulales bacterium]|nr:hypothetical protein [Pirellulales bacterium]
MKDVLLRVFGAIPAALAGVGSTLALTQDPRALFLVAAGWLGNETLQAFRAESQGKNLDETREVLFRVARDLASRKTVAEQVALSEGLDLAGLDPESSDFPHRNSLAD